MPITLEATRPKAEITNDTPLTLDIGTVIQDDALNTFFIPIEATGLTIPDFSIVDATITSGSNSITVTGDSFAEVEIGDAIAEVVGVLPASTVVTKLDNNTITVSNNATASSTSTLTMTPVGGGAVDITLVGIKISFINSIDSNTTIVATGYIYDGNLKGTEGTDQNATREINLNQFNINIDSILATARIPRSN